jgi:excisionase family DNA binding protein
MIPDKPHFRIDEAASICDVHPNTIRRWIDDGKLDHIRLPGGGIRIPHTAVLKLLEPTRRDPHADC